MSDDEYESELRTLRHLCATFVAAHDDPTTGRAFLLLLVGQLLGQIANVYNLSEPGGLMHPSALFRDE